MILEKINNRYWNDELLAVHQTFISYVDGVICMYDVHCSKGCIYSVWLSNLVLPMDFKPSTTSDPLSDIFLPLY